MGAVLVASRISSETAVDEEETPVEEDVFEKDVFGDHGCEIFLRNAIEKELNGSLVIGARDLCMKAGGMRTGVAGELKTYLGKMERPLTSKGRRVFWYTALLELKKLDRPGWYGVSKVVWGNCD